MSGGETVVVSVPFHFILRYFVASRERLKPAKSALLKRGKTYKTITVRWTYVHVMRVWTASPTGLMRLRTELYVGVQEDLDRIDERRIELVMRMWTALIVGRTDLVMRMHCFCCWYLVDLMLVSRRARQERPSTNVKQDLDILKCTT